MSNDLDKFENRLKKMENGAKSINGENNVPFSELFNRSFMLKHTNNVYPSLNDFTEAGKFGDVPFREIPDKDWEKWVVASTDFPSWSEMQKSATKAWTAHKLGF